MTTLYDFAYNELIQDIREVIVRSSRPKHMVSSIKVLLNKINLGSNKNLQSFMSNKHKCLDAKAMLISDMICNICTSKASKRLVLYLAPFTKTIQKCADYKSQEFLIFNTLEKQYSVNIERNLDLGNKGNKVGRTIRFKKTFVEMTKEQKFYFTFMMDLHCQFSSVAVFWPFVDRKTSNMIAIIPKKKDGYSDIIWDLKFIVPSSTQSSASGMMDRTNILSD